MDVLTLDTFFKPKRLVENYETMIWKEKYHGPGDFELHTFDIEQTLSLLPLNTCISLRDTGTVQIVENLLIENGKLKVSGRTIETVLNRRFVWVEMIPADYLANQIRYLINDVISVGTPFIPPLTVFYAFNESSDVLFGGQNERFFSKEPVYDAISIMLQELSLSVKANRLNPNASLPSGRLQLSIFKGKDRTISSSLPTSEKVIFSVDSEQIKNGSYLMTSTNFKNVVTYEVPVPDVDGNLDSYATRRIGINGSEAEPTPNLGTYWGQELELSELYADTTDTTFMNDMESISPNLREEYAKSLALNELRSRQQINFVAAEVSEYTDKKYNVDYGLGDIVTVQGEYGMNADLMISEYIRIHDKLGDREYPTLVTPT